MSELSPDKELRRQQMLARVSDTTDLIAQGLFIGESAYKVMQLYNQEVAKAAANGTEIDDYETWVRKRAADRILQGYATPQRSFFGSVLRKFGF